MNIFFARKIIKDLKKSLHLGVYKNFTVVFHIKVPKGLQSDFEINFILIWFTSKNDTGFCGFFDLLTTHKLSWQWYVNQRNEKINLYRHIFSFFVAFLSDCIFFSVPCQLWFRKAETFSKSFISCIPLEPKLNVLKELFLTPFFCTIYAMYQVNNVLQNKLLLLDINCSFLLLARMEW